MNTLDIIGATIGLFYIVSEYRADRWFWPFSLLMSAFYIVIDFGAGIYANGTICCYNFIMSVYGLLVWRGVVGSTTKEERPISSCPRRYWPWLLLVMAALAGGLFGVLKSLNERLYENVSPELEFLLDSVTSAISIVGMFMVSQKWWEQWLCWMVVNPMMVFLFYLSGNYASAVLYVVFEVFCVLGAIRWRREAKAVKP